MCPADWVLCGGIPLSAAVGQVFKHKVGSNRISWIRKFQVLMPETDMVIPADLLADHHVFEGIRLACSTLGTQKMKIDSEAFRSSI
jgi:hypothetical protein